MASSRPHTRPTRRRLGRRSPNGLIAFVSRRLSASGSECGQALILTTVAMLVIMVMAAFSIDLATWYQKHHQAQVAADSAALAAANCLANGKTTNNGCSSATDTTGAVSVATTIASSNLPTSTNAVTVNTTDHTVTVTSQAHPAIDFAGFVSLSPTVSARAVASYASAQAPYSVFVGNDTCNSGSGLQIASNGGGNATVNGLYSDGVIDNSDNSGSANYSGGISNGQTTGGYSAGGTPLCGNGQGSAGSLGSNNLWLTKNTTVATGQETAYPVQYVAPTIGSSTIKTSYPNSPPSVTPGTCTFASTYFASDGTGMHQLRWPGIYCVIDSSGNISAQYSGTCAAGNGSKPSSTDDTSGSIYINSTLEGSYEFVGPCVVGDTYISSNLTAINSLTPLIYGTAQAASPCLSPPDNFVNPTAIVGSPNNVVLSNNNNLLLNAPVYAPCGTADITANNNFNGFVEAANVTIDKNNFQSWLGTGPNTAPATDGLAG